MGRYIFSLAWLATIVTFGFGCIEEDETLLEGEETAVQEDESVEVGHVSQGLDTWKTKGVVHLQFVDFNFEERGSCNGLILDERTILTTAGCVRKSVLPFGHSGWALVRVIYDRQEEDVYCLTNNSEAYGVCDENDLGVARFIIHENYTHTSDTADDIAVVKIYFRDLTPYRRDDRATISPNIPWRNEIGLFTYSCRSGNSLGERMLKTHRNYRVKIGANENRFRTNGDLCRSHIGGAAVDRRGNVLGLASNYTGGWFLKTVPLVPGGYCSTSWNAVRVERKECTDGGARKRFVGLLGKIDWIEDAAGIQCDLRQKSGTDQYYWICD